MLKEKLKSAIVATGSRNFWNEQLIEEFCEKYKYYDVNKIVEILEDKIIAGIEFKYSDMLRAIREEIKETKVITCNYAICTGDHLAILNYAFANAKNLEELYTILGPLRQWLINNNYWIEEGKWYEKTNNKN
ncbi:MAG: SAM-dependent methyltransferase [Bacteroidales bacterium]|nr:SAM-dependent methyltransferase [Bacteroidales bacterium]